MDPVAYFRYWVFFEGVNFYSWFEVHVPKLLSFLVNVIYDLFLQFSGDDDAKSTSRDVRSAKSVVIQFFAEWSFPHDKLSERGQPPSQSANEDQSQYLHLESPATFFFGREFIEKELHHYCALLNIDAISCLQDFRKVIRGSGRTAVGSLDAQSTRAEEKKKMRALNEDLRCASKLVYG